MATLTEATYPAGAMGPVAGMLPGDREAVIPLSDGGALRVVIETDDHTSIERYGMFADEWRYSRQRPDEMDGSAVKITAEFRSLWFQPDKSYAPKDRPAVIARVRGYLLEHWSFVGVVVTRTAPAVTGPFGGALVDSVSASLWGIGSDEGPRLAEVATDLARDLGCIAE